LLTILALSNLRLRSADGVVDLPAGQTISLPLEKVEALLAKVPDKIRVIRSGWTVTWDSPLFGLCEGKITEIKADFFKITEHGVTKEQATIPAAWIAGIDSEAIA